MKGNIKFTGKSIVAKDLNKFYIELFPECLKEQEKKNEEFVFDSPNIFMGNLIIGETYIEPQGTIDILNLDTKQKC